MRDVLCTTAEALLRPFGIRRKRRRSGDNEGAPSHDDQESYWEVDPCHFVVAASGALVTWWAIGKLKSSQSAPLADQGGSSVGSAGFPRLALSDFLHLLRAGAVTAVTYLADRPPAGSLVVRGAIPIAAAAGPLLSAAAGARDATTTTAETLLIPGCHQGLFEELRAQQGVLFECAELAASEPDYSRLSLLIDAGGLCASLAALVYLLRNSNQTLFSGKHLEDGARADVDRRPAVTFDDVAGMAGTKEELREVISFLRNPRSFFALGARPPRGLLLAGPSGTGKTLLARAVAGESGVPFLYASSAAFVEVFVGQGAQRVRQFYEQARASAPCIVFLDELDAIGSARQAGASGGNQEYAQTLNQLLLELDGVESHSSGGADGSPLVVTIAATNRYDCLDEALVRPGRLDRIVLVALPNHEERAATLKIHARKLHTEDLDLEALARRTEGQSGADLANLLNEAALLAARRGADAVRMEHVAEVLRTPRPPQRPRSRGEGWWAGGDGSPGDLDTAAPQASEFFTGMLAAAAAAMTAGRRASSTPRSTAEATTLD